MNTDDEKESDAFKVPSWAMKGETEMWIWKSALLSPTTWVYNWFWTILSLLEQDWNRDNSKSHRSLKFGSC